MITNGENNFNASGPKHLTAFDWENPDDRRTVIASLVKGVYVSEDDRQKNLKGTQALAPSWWESFHFELNKVLIDTNDKSIYGDGSIFGAIYQLKSSVIVPKGPKFVVAFRGTMLQKSTRHRDLLLDAKVITNRLTKSSRFKKAITCVNDLVNSEGVDKVWLAGHSLGAAIALVTGKKMAKKGFSLETYLFNPPMISLTLEWIKHKKLKEKFYKARAFARVALKSAVGTVIEVTNKHQEREVGDPFAAISAWVPRLFLNPGDLISSAYIGYFKTREDMEKRGLATYERLATGSSIIRSLFAGKFHKNIEPMHLLASAELTINPDKSLDSHSLQQWYHHHIRCETKFYRYTSQTQTTIMSALPSS